MTGHRLCSYGLSSISALLFNIQVGGFIDNGVRSPLHLRQDFTDVLSDNANENQLDCREEEKADDDRCNANRECVPINEFIDEIQEGHHQIKPGQTKPGKGSQPERQLGVIDEPGYGVAIERKKIMA